MNKMEGQREGCEILDTKGEMRDSRKRKSKWGKIKENLV